MHAMIKTIASIGLGIAAGHALAGPDWDVINRARAAAQDPSMTSSATPAKEAMLSQCNAMFKQMNAHPMGSSKDGQPVASPTGTTEAK